MEGNSSQDSKPLSRRDLIKRAGVAAGVAAGSLGIGLGIRTGYDYLNRYYSQSPEARYNGPPQFPEPSSHAPEAAVSKEPLIALPTEFGWNTHLNVDGNPRENHTLEALKRCVDDISSNGSRRLRMDFRHWQMVESGDTDRVVWRDEGIGQFDDAISYINESGLKLALVVTAPEYAAEYDREDYIKATRIFFGTIANRYQGMIDTLQLYNEPDIHRFKTYRFDNHALLKGRYFQELEEAMEAAYEAVKQADPNIRTIANISHWVGHHTDMTRKGVYFFDRIGHLVDVLGLGPYLEDNQRAIDSMPIAIEDLQTRYNKPVEIVELGQPTIGRFTEIDQARNVSNAMGAMMGGEVQPAAIMLYEYRDETIVSDGVEKTFGFRNADDSPKISYNVLVGKMQQESENEFMQK